MSRYQGPKRQYKPFDLSRFGDPGPIVHALPPSDEGQTTREPDVGISQYAQADLPGFSAIIKHRYSDFNVFEIDPQGQVVRLQSLTPPDLDAKPNIDFQEMKHLDVPEDERKFFTSLTWLRLVQLAKKALLKEDTMPSETVSVDVTTRTKEERKQVHQIVRKYFPHLQTFTEDKTIGDELKKVISVLFKTTGDQKKADDREWPRERPKFLHFTLYKEDLDSMQAFNALSKCLGKKYKFTFAGTKDKRSRSTQRCAISFVTPKQLISAAKRTYFNQDRTALAVGDFSFERKAIRLGDHQGNHFALVLRHVDSRENAEKGLEGLKTHGFINYFGLQRFGNSCVKTSDVGLAIIRGQWQEAIELILKPRSNDRFLMKQAREFWWQYRKSDIALRILGHHSQSIEGSVFKGLKLSNEKFGSGAMNYVNKNSRLMYVHAYQSLVWNKAVSRRVSKHGLKVVLGDLYLKEEVPEVTNEEPMEDQEVSAQTENEDKVPLVEAKDENGVKDGNEAKDENEAKFGRNKVNVSIVSPENINDVSIHDVVMPLPGKDIQYPDNDIKDMYEAILKEDGLDFESFENSSREYSLGGDYRKIVAQAGNLQWRFIRYTDPNKTLVISDYNRVMGLPEIADEEEGPYLGLILEFSLKTSNYATMAIREISRIDTGKEQQGQLTEQHQTQDEERKRKADEQKENGAGPVKKIKTDDTKDAESTH
ncbi:hypothetical protein TCAL_09032 [Tigriopus californicus]|uniref:TRUD domain-containing protein n=1 Tax=Tigriopus californicus TaxID=6832 RepID=A0A553ND47_TIGCA|nr:pseudouridylate synthase 7 homolog [Tigriopus californicus]TRY63376.1 hypothetical protein TCAL_09032 [Tigriopus californicus]